jgi:putative membrane protein
VGGALAVLWQGADLLGYRVPFGNVPLRDADIREGVKFARSVLPSIGGVVVEVLAVVVLLRLLSIAWAAVKLHGFTLERDGEILRARYGLVTRYAAAIPRHRVQTLTVMETPILRLTRRAAVKVQTAARFQAEQGRVGAEWVAPVIERRRLAALLAEVLPGIEIERLPWRPVDPAAWRRDFRGGLLVTGLVTICLVGPLGWWALAAPAALIPWTWFAARKIARYRAFAITDDAFAFRSGWINHRLTVVRMVRVQSVRLDESFLDRRWRMATVGVDTAGSAHRVAVPYLPRATADELFARVRNSVST